MIGLVVPQRARRGCGQEKRGTGKELLAEVHIAAATPGSFPALSSPSLPPAAWPWFRSVTIWSLYVRLQVEASEKHVCYGKLGGKFVKPQQLMEGQASQEQRKAPSSPTAKCSICDTSFRRPEHLKRHLRSHTKEKPFECVQCNRRFSRRYV
jgi:Zinc finger, C2H2 type